MKIQSAQTPKMKKPSGFWFRALSNFADSDKECIEIIPAPEEYRDTRSLQTTLSGVIHRYKFNMSTKYAEDRVYVIKKIRKDNV